ncbi:MAG: YggS family pyridoxal phosphate-dependent enzyme [Spirochaetaceae bacterium]
MGIEENVREVRESITEACIRAGRDPQEVTLMGVTKNHGPEVVRAGYEAGLRCFGENRVQEAAEKYTQRPEDLDLHLVGHLQRNKARAACELFSTVQSIDRLETAEALEKHCAAGEVSMRVLLEVNTSAEETKYGVRGEDSLRELLEGILPLEHVHPVGLMTLAPFTEEEHPIRRSFRELRRLFMQLRSGYPDLDFSVLSMGMSNDYLIAVEEGTTMVRLGTRLFGERRR